MEDSEKLRKINAWREDGKHLPPFMRDFHDQKEFMDEQRKASTAILLGAMNQSSNKDKT